MTTTIIAAHLCSTDGCTNETHDVLCGSCERAVSSALHELPRLYVDLHTELEPSSGSGEHVSGSREAPVPLRVEISALMTDMAGTCEDWEDDLRRTEGYTDRPDRGREGPRLTGAATFLRAHLDQLIHHPQGLTAVDEILTLRSRARTVLNFTNPVDRLPAPCPACDHLGLIRHNGASLVLCSYCDRTWTETEYARLVYWLVSINAGKPQEAS